MARSYFRMKGSLLMLQPTRGYIGGLFLLQLISTGCGPSAVCTSDLECQDRFGPYSACILSGDRGLCYVDEEATQKSKRDDVNFSVSDGGDGDTDLLFDGGQSFVDAGSGDDVDAGLFDVEDAGDSGLEDAGTVEEMPAPPQIEYFDVDQSDFFVEAGVLLTWQVTGADACVLFQDNEAQPLNATELSTGSSRQFPTQSVSYSLKCSRTLGGNTAAVQSEPVIVTPLPAVQITSLRANEASETLRINAESAVRYQWSSAHAARCYWSLQFSGDTVVNETSLENDAIAEGEITLDADAPGTFRLRCVGNGPEAQASIEVQLATLSSFVAQESLIAQGDSTLLQWTLENSEENCELHDGEDWVEVEGSSYSVAPTTSTIYQLRCAGAGGDPLEASIDVRVLRIASFTATSESIRYGDEITLAWQSDEAASCEVKKDGSLAFTVPDEERNSGQYASGTLYENTTFVLRCYDGNVVVESDEINVVIEVTIVDFSARIDPSVTDTIRLTWKAEATRDAQRCSLAGFMGFMTDQVDLPQSNPGLGPVTTYTLTCYGEQGDELTDQASLKVIWGSGGEGGAENWENADVIMGNLFLDSSHEGGDSTLQSLKDVGGSIVMQNPSFRALSLPELRTVYGGMRISGSEVLEDIHFPQLSEIGEELVINGNSALTTLEFPNLTKIDGDFQLSDTGVGTTLGMDSLSLVTGELEISNSQLDSLAGLSSLRKVEGEFLRISSNPELSCSEIDAFYCALDATRPFVWVNNNESSTCSLSCTP